MIKQIHAENYGVYGARKIWHELHRGGVPVARCTVERLMRAAGLRGLLRDKSPRTTRPAAETDRPRDLVKRDFTAVAPEPAVGRGSDLRAHRRGLGVRRVRPRRVLPHDRRLAGLHLALHRSGARRAEDGDLAPRESGR